MPYVAVECPVYQHAISERAGCGVSEPLVPRSSCPTGTGGCGHTASVLRLAHGCGCAAHSRSPSALTALMVSLSRQREKTAWRRCSWWNWRFWTAPTEMPTSNHVRKRLGSGWPPPQLFVHTPFSFRWHSMWTVKQNEGWNDVHLIGDQQSHFYCFHKLWMLYLFVLYSSMSSKFGVYKLLLFWWNFYF